MDTGSPVRIDIIAEFTLEACWCTITKRTLGHVGAVIGRAYSTWVGEVVTGITDGAGGPWGGIPVAVGNSICLDAKTEEKRNEE